jgi:hypothetical protein
VIDIYALIEQIRNAYVDAFRSFVEEQHRSCKTGSAEVKLQLGGQSKLFNRSYCVDFVDNDDGDGDVVEFTFDQHFSFTALRGDLGNLSVTFTSMRWNGVIISHDLKDLPADAIATWFEQWYDPSNQHHDDSAEFSNTIHSLLVEPEMLSIDFGTAPTEAFWSLLNLLEEAGVRLATITCNE